MSGTEENFPSQESGRLSRSCAMNRSLGEIGAGAHGTPLLFSPSSIPNNGTEEHFDCRESGRLSPSCSVHDALGKTCTDEDATELNDLNIFHLFLLCGFEKNEAQTCSCGFVISKHCEDFPLGTRTCAASRCERRTCSNAVRNECDRFDLRVIPSSSSRYPARLEIVEFRQRQLTRKIVTANKAFIHYFFNVAHTSMKAKGKDIYDRSWESQLLSAAGYGKFEDVDAETHFKISDASSSALEDAQRKHGCAVCGEDVRNRPLYDPCPCAYAKRDVLADASAQIALEVYALPRLQCVERVYADRCEWHALGMLSNILFSFTSDRLFDVNIAVVPDLNARSSRDAKCDVHMFTRFKMRCPTTWQLESKVVHCRLGESREYCHLLRTAGSICQAVSIDNETFSSLVFSLIARPDDVHCETACSALKKHYSGKDFQRAEHVARSFLHHPPLAAFISKILAHA